MRGGYGRTGRGALHQRLRKVNVLLIAGRTMQQQDGGVGSCAGRDIELGVGNCGRNGVSRDPPGSPAGDSRPAECGTLIGCTVSGQHAQNAGNPDETRQGEVKLVDPEWALKPGRHGQDQALVMPTQALSPDVACSSPFFDLRFCVCSGLAAVVR